MRGRADDPRARVSLGLALAVGLLAIAAAGSNYIANPVGELFGAEEFRLRIDPNAASEDELALLPGIGPGRAAAIVAYRDELGGIRAFAEPADLQRVRGIGPKTAARIARDLQFLSEASEATRTGSQ